MSNNPFLKTKNTIKSNNTVKSSNRFQFLDDEDVSDKPIKKEKKISTPYNSSENSFSKSFVRKDDNRKDDNRRDNNRRDDNINKFSSKKPEIKPVFSLETESFPDLSCKKENVSNKLETDKLSTNFKDILRPKTKTEEISNTQNKIRPGWVEISNKQNKIIYNYGPKTCYEIKMKQQEELEKTPNYIMNKAITMMIENWERFKENYDDINGEGAYEQIYVLPPVYDSDEDDCEYGDDNDDENSFDYEADEY